MRHPAPILLLTRPRAQGESFVRVVAEQAGPVTPVIAPLVQIVCTGTLPPLDAYTGLIFTSQNGLRCFIGQSPDRRLPAYCVGPGTTQAARAEGFAATQAGADAERLIATLTATPPGGRLLHLRGAHGRGAVAQTLSAAGQPCDEHILYTQDATPPTQAARAALMGETPVVLPLFSPRSARLAGEAAQGATAPLFVVFMSAVVEGAWAGPTPQLALRAATPDGTAMLTAVTDAIAASRRLEGGASAG